MRLLPLFACLTAMTAPIAAMAEDARPTPVPGPVFTDFGAPYRVDSDVAVPRDSRFKLLFDVHQGTKPGQINRAVDRAARFINLNVAAGVPEENIHIAIVVHGEAGADLLRDDVYRARFNGIANASAGPISQLLAHGVAIYLCGQSATAKNMPKADLVPGVKMAPSAMTMDALLQQQGYTLIP
ncbi:MAG: DsrE family protein [Sphingobium sp.]